MPNPVRRARIGHGAHQSGRRRARNGAGVPFASIHARGASRSIAGRRRSCYRVDRECDSAWPSACSSTPLRRA